MRTVRQHGAWGRLWASPKTAPPGGAAGGRNGPSTHSISPADPHPAVWTPKGGASAPIRISFAAPHIKVDAPGQPIDTVQVFAGGLASELGTARAGDVREIGRWRWALSADPESYGGADLVRMTLTGPLKPQS